MITHMPILTDNLDLSLFLFVRPPIVNSATSKPVDFNLPLQEDLKLLTYTLMQIVKTQHEAEKGGEETRGFLIGGLGPNSDDCCLTPFAVRRSNPQSSSLQLWNPSCLAPASTTNTLPPKTLPPSPPSSPISNHQPATSK